MCNHNHFVGFELPRDIRSSSSAHLSVRREACSIRRVALERKSLSSARSSSDCCLGLRDRVHHATGNRKDERATIRKPVADWNPPHSGRCLRGTSSKGDILLILNLEDTPKNLAPFAIERSRGIRCFCPWQSTLFLSGFARSTIDHADPTLPNPLTCQEVTMSARNGDKSRFHRERKQKIARRKRNQEILARAASEGRPADTTARAKPRSVPA